MGKLWSKLEKKDFGYIILFLILAIIFLVLRGNLDKSEVVNVISIGAGLTSIFLALVAIDYAFKQADDSARQNESVSNTLYLINGKVHELSLIEGHLREVMQDFQTMREDVTSFREDSRADKEEIISLLQELRESSPLKDISTDEVPQQIQDKLKRYEEIVGKIQLNLKKSTKSTCKYRVTLKSQSDITPSKIMDSILPLPLPGELVSYEHVESIFYNPKFNAVNKVTYDARELQQDSVDLGDYEFRVKLDITIDSEVDIEPRMIRYIFESAGYNVVRVQKLNIQSVFAG